MFEMDGNTGVWLFPTSPYPSDLDPSAQCDIILFCGLYFPVSLDQNFLMVSYAVSLGYFLLVSCFYNNDLFVLQINMFVQIVIFTWVKALINFFKFHT